MFLNKNLLKIKLKLMVSSLCFLSLLPAHAGIVNLGTQGAVNLASASDYTFAAIASEYGELGSFSVGVEAKIFGNVAANNSLIIGSDVNINGNACSNYVAKSPGTVISGDEGLNGDCANVLTTLGTDIKNASAQAQALAGLSIDNIAQSVTLSASQSQVFFTDELFLETGEFLTISGSQNDGMLVNVRGLASIGSGAGIRLTGGILANNVIFNFLDNDTATNFIIGAAELQGTFLSGSRSYQLGDGATLNGTRFLTTDSILGNVQTVIGLTDTIPVPEPHTSLFLLPLAWLLFRSKKSNNTATVL